MPFDHVRVICIENRQWQGRSEFCVRELSFVPTGQNRVFRGGAQLLQGGSSKLHLVQQEQ